jgi:hypothetical protein
VKEKAMYVQQENDIGEPEPPTIELFVYIKNILCVLRFYVALSMFCIPVFPAFPAFPTCQTFPIFRACPAYPTFSGRENLMRAFPHC